MSEAPLKAYKHLPLKSIWFGEGAATQNEQRFVDGCPGPGVPKVVRVATMNCG